MAGKEIRKYQTLSTFIGENKLKIDLSGLESGSYQLVISKSGFRTTTRFIKN
jgi:hypothetical protein